MLEKKIPLRKCVITQERLPKKELIRVLRTPSMEVVIDLTGRANGRGAYLKKDVLVIEKARKNKILDKQLEVSVPDEIYDKLIEIVKNGK